MADPKNNNDKNNEIAHRSDETDDVDEDLLTPSSPLPNPISLVFALMILTMSATALVWFFPELRYGLNAFYDPINLDEAANVDMRTLKPDRLAAVDGLPMTQHTLVFKEGVKWFVLSDNARKFFPLTDRPHLYIQRTETAAQNADPDPGKNPEILGQPTHFQGRLIARKAMGHNYDRIWVYYDCLKYHSIGQCDYCLGRTSLDECRDAFVCAETVGEACEEILSKSEGPLNAEITSAEKSGNRETVERLKKIRAALKENAVQTRAVELEEIGLQAGRLQEIAVKDKSPLIPTLDKTRAKILRLRTEELHIRAGDALRTIDSLNEAQKKEIRDLHAELERLTVEESSLVSTIKQMTASVSPPSSEQAPPALDSAQQITDRTDTLNAVRERILKIQTTPGFNAMKEVDSLHSIESSLRDSMPLDNADDAARKIDALIAEMSALGLYLADLKGAPEEMSKLGNLITKKKINELKSDLAEAVQTLEPDDFVLVDGEIPRDKLWVVIIYIALVLMIFINVRRIIRFVDAYRK